LSATSLLALGVIWYLSKAFLDPPRIIDTGLIGGWVLMPSILVLSLRWPPLRIWVIIPSALETLALLSMCMYYLPFAPTARLGWMLTTAGVLLGDVLGAWFWFHWANVPPLFVDPFSAGRWILIIIHVALIVVGLGLVAVSGMQVGSALS
jgi:hypothetical protein